MTGPGVALEMASRRETRASAAGHPAGWLRLIVLPAAVLISGRHLAAWALMWGLAIAIFSALKWMTWWRGRGIVPQVSLRRSLAYLFLWPGMDAPTFLDARRSATPATGSELLRAMAAALLGVFLLFGAVRIVPSSLPLVAGWIGLFGLIFVLHFGTFRLLSIWWRWHGIEAVPVMRAPVAAASLGEFWGARWNTAFHVLARDYVVRPLRHRIGVPASMLVAFVGSGLVHDLVISVPGGAGYGVAAGPLFPHGVGLRRRGPLFAIAVTALPAFWLFHPAFVLNVVVPFLRVVGAR